MTPRPEALVLETDAGPAALGQIEAHLRRTWEAHAHVPETVRIEVGIAAGEIGANIVEHAAAGRQVRIRMEVRVLIDEVWVEFADDGVPARVDLESVRMPDGLVERGRGLALARAALDKLAYRRNSENHWTLVSKRF